MQLFMFAENLFDHHIERLGVLSLCIPDQAAQALKILRGIAQTIDVIEPQALHLAFRDEFLHQTMDGVERAGILHAQPGECIDIEKPPIVDVAGGQPPMAELVVLALKQMMKRQSLRRPVRSRAIGLDPPGDNVGTSGDVLELGLERRRLTAIGMAQSAIARRKLENAFSRRVIFSSGFSYGGAQNLAVTLRRDRQPVFEIPGRETAFIAMVAKFDLALF